MIRIYADFNHRDEQRRVVLDTVGSLADIKKYTSSIHEGMTILLIVEDEFEVQGTLIFDGVWLAIPDFSTLHDMQQTEAE